MEKAKVNEKCEIRLFHVLTGDSVPTNTAAGRFLLGHFEKVIVLGGRQMCILFDLSCVRFIPSQFGRVDGNYSLISGQS